MPIITGKRALLVTGLATVMTMAVPPAGAWWLNHRRVVETVQRIEAVSRDVAAGGREVPPLGLFRGPGRVPDREPMGSEGVGIDATQHASWLAASPAPTPLFDRWHADAWGQCIFLARREGGTLVLSAGANGVVETPTHAVVPAGDDIGLFIK